MNYRLSDITLSLQIAFHLYYTIQGCKYIVSKSESTVSIY